MIRAIPNKRSRARRLLPWVVWVAICAVLLGCGSSRPQTRRYQLKGTVVEVDKEQGHLVVNHEEIPGFMGAMTMPYPVADPKALDQLGPGDQITADVVVVEGQGAKLENIVVVKKGAGAKPGAASLQRLQRGSAVPGFMPVNQGSKRIDSLRTPS